MLVTTEPRKVQIDEAALVTAWQLIYTREWPFSMMTDLACFKSAFDEAMASSPANVK